MEWGRSHERAQADNGRIRESRGASDGAKPGAFRPKLRGFQTAICGTKMGTESGTL